MYCPHNTIPNTEDINKQIRREKNKNIQTRLNEISIEFLLINRFFFIKNNKAKAMNNIQNSSITLQPKVPTEEENNKKRNIFNKKLLGFFNTYIPIDKPVNKNEIRKGRGNSQGRMLFVRGTPHLVNSVPKTVIKRKNTETFNQGIL